jgi:nitroimidazol reductase NimA-like FMN-containing flavoprotein (pyridoxamine 5'-phosphate oxidase superfamily)
MRKATFFAMAEDEALALTDRAETMHLASVGGDGQPVLRALHVARVGRAFYFHGAPVGEKTETFGARAVLSSEEDVARIPSHFLDPERACPATTLYRSVQLHGTLERITCADEKARALQALMQKLQPEGGYMPITASSPLYTKALAGIDVVRLVPDVIQGKKKLGQNRTPTERARLYAGLLGRGERGDYAAVEAILGANPDDTRPPALLAEDGTPLIADLDEARIHEAAALLAGAYWLEGVPRETVLGAFRSSRVRVGAAGSDGRLVAAARATSDGRVA